MFLHTISMWCFLGMIFSIVIAVQALYLLSVCCISLLVIFVVAPLITMVRLCNLLRPGDGDRGLWRPSCVTL